MIQLRSIVEFLRKRGALQRALWLDIIKEIGILIGVYLIYSISRGSIDAKASIAFQHAQDIMHLEKTLGIFVERHIQSFFLESSFRINIANGIYTYCYYPPLIIFAIWGYWRHRKKYKVIRTVFVISAIMAFIIFALYPVAPPRFFDGNHNVADAGFVDTIVKYWNVDDKSIGAFYNPYAAMPSLHQGWTLLVAIGIFWMAKPWWGKLIGFAIPITIFFGITGTGNHFVLDSLGGVIVIAIALGLTILLLKLLGKFKPEENKTRSFME